MASLLCPECLSGQVYGIERLTRKYDLVRGPLLRYEGELSEVLYEGAYTDYSDGGIEFFQCDKCEVEWKGDGVLLDQYHAMVFPLLEDAHG